MTRSLLALLLAAAAAHAQPRQPKLKLVSLELAPLEVCSGAGQPASWRDASDAFTFAAHPTAWHDQQELAAANLAPLAGVVFDGAHVRLLLVGIPALTPPALTLRYSGIHTGWTLRWPHCSIQTP